MEVCEIARVGVVGAAGVSVAIVCGGCCYEHLRPGYVGPGDYAVLTR